MLDSTVSTQTTTQNLVNATGLNKNKRAPRLIQTDPRPSETFSLYPESTGAASLPKHGSGPRANIATPSPLIHPRPSHPSHKHTSLLSPTPSGSSHHDYVPPATLSPQSSRLDIHERSRERQRERDRSRSRLRRARRHNLNAHLGAPFHPPTLPTGPGGRRTFQKLLWVSQPFPDNYTDADTFLDHLQRNPRLRLYEFWPLVADSSVIVQQVCAILIFVCCFVGIVQEKISPVTVVSWATGGTVAGWCFCDGVASNTYQTVLRAWLRVRGPRATDVTPTKEAQEDKSAVSSPNNAGESNGGVGLGLEVPTESYSGSWQNNRTQSPTLTKKASRSRLSTLSSRNSSVNFEVVPEVSAVHSMSSSSSAPSWQHVSSRSSATPPTLVTQNLPSMNVQPPTNSSGISGSASMKVAFAAQTTSPTAAGSTPAYGVSATQNLSPRTRQRLSTAKSAILIYFALLGLSPILKSLTKSTASDSIWAISFWLMCINVFFFDYGPSNSNTFLIPTSQTSPVSPIASHSRYSSASINGDLPAPSAPATMAPLPVETISALSSNSNSPNPPNPPEPQTPAAPGGGNNAATFPASLSTNAALMASTVLASRLPSTTHVFSLTLFSIEVFGLFPIFRRYLRAVSWPGHFALTWALVMGAGGSVAVVLLQGASVGEGTMAGIQAPQSSWIGPVLAGMVLSSLLTGLGMGLCSWWLIGMQRYKNEIHGPWDAARPLIRKKWD